MGMRAILFAINLTGREREREREREGECERKKEFRRMRDFKYRSPPGDPLMLSC